jgi:putative phosphoserine phosphatase/1-acylglycerol-3-phosphate O-acyltransferase
MGPIGSLMDAAFIDRADSESAVASLKPLEELGRKGLSIGLAPEGQRSPDGELGPFKKGAFRMAMATGHPIIPIVIRNAEVLGSRDANSMRPGTVEVVVLPPVPVTHWKLEDLDEHITEVRNLYVKTLADWPG